MVGSPENGWVFQVGMFPWKRGGFSGEPAVKTSGVYLLYFFSANQKRWGCFTEVVIMIAIPKKVFLLTHVFL